MKNKMNFKSLLALMICFVMVFYALPVFATEIGSTDQSEGQTVSESVDIAYGGKDKEMDDMFDDIIANIRAFKEKNPNASDEKLNKYTEKLLKNAVKKNQGEVGTLAYDMDGYLTGYLNPLEQALYNSNKTKALLCMANGKMAISYAQSNYQNTEAVQHNGNGDAFRHCLWNFGMAIDVGQSFAKQWSDAHENGTPNNPANERTMDLFNNGVGLQLAKDNPGTILHSTFISKSKAKCRAGELRIIRNGVIVRSDSVGEI